jgi:hypothetical protein
MRCAIVSRTAAVAAASGAAGADGACAQAGTAAQTTAMNTHPRAWARTTPQFLIFNGCLSGRECAHAGRTGAARLGLPE